MSHRTNADRNPFRRAALGAAAAVAVGCAAPAALAQVQPYSCTALRSVSLPNVVIKATTEVALPSPQKPSDTYCQVDGVIVTDGLNGEPSNGVVFRVALPTKSWNGKLLVEGNGAHGGALPGFSGLARGYAQAGTDTGHTGTAFGNVYVDTYDGRWAFNSMTKQADFGYRAVHATTDTAKALVAIFYGQAPARSYFNGCSLGGRQAWVEAQRYPKDFDGILAGAAFNDYNVAKMELNWNQRWQLKDAAHYLPQSKFVYVGHAVTAACDAKDGVVDGLIEDPRKCGFDPASMQCSSSDTTFCLSAGQVETLKMIYQGARTSSGQQVTPGWLPVPRARNMYPSWLTVE